MLPNGTTSSEALGTKRPRTVRPEVAGPTRKASYPEPTSKECGMIREKPTNTVIVMVTRRRTRPSTCTFLRVQDLKLENARMRLQNQMSPATPSPSSSPCTGPASKDRASQRTKRTR